MLILKLDLLENPTFGDLYRFADLARSAGIPADRPLEIETDDNVGNEIGPHMISADLGNLDEISRPILIDGRDARDFAEAVSYLHTQGHVGEQNDEAVSRLLDLLWRGPAT